MSGKFLNFDVLILSILINTKGELKPGSPVFFPSCDGFLPSFEPGQPKKTQFWKAAWGQKNMPKPSFEKVLGEKFFLGPKNAQNRRKLPNFRKKSQNFLQKCLIISKFCQIFRQKWQKTAKFRVF